MKGMLSGPVTILNWSFPREDISIRESISQIALAIRDEVLCPILFLSARQAESDKIQGLTLGGDDYITKPFGMRELMAKIEANLRRERRAQGAGATQRRPRLYFGEIAIDLRARCVQVGDVQLALTKHEYAVVEFLALHPGQIFSREQIYERVWGYDAEGNCLLYTSDAADD